MNLDHLATVANTVAQGWLAAVTWRPGWTLELAGPAVFAELAALRVTGTVTDTRTGRPQLIAHRHTVAPWALDSREAFYRWLLETLQRVDMHECAEWFRVDGVQVADPHAEGGRYEGRILPDAFGTCGATV